MTIDPPLPSGIAIRPFHDADLPAIRILLNALQEAECGMESNRVHWSDGAAAYAAHMLEEMRANDGAAFVATAASGDVVGFAACWRVANDAELTVQPDARPQLYVSELVVSEAWRGREIAGALLAACEAHGVSLGLRQMTIGVLAANRPALRAYAKHGFEDYEMFLRKKF